MSNKLKEQALDQLNMIYKFEEYVVECKMMEIREYFKHFLRGEEAKEAWSQLLRTHQAEEIQKYRELAFQLISNPNYLGSKQEEYDKRMSLEDRAYELENLLLLLPFTTQNRDNILKIIGELREGVDTDDKNLILVMPKGLN